MAKCSRTSPGPKKFFGLIDRRESRKWAVGGRSGLWRD